MMVSTQTPWSKKMPMNFRELLRTMSYIIWFSPVNHLLEYKVKATVIAIKISSTPNKMYSSFCGSTPGGCAILGNLAI